MPFLPPFTTLARGVGGWRGVLRGNRRGLGRDLGLEGRVRCRHGGPSSACTSGSARSGQGFSSSPGQDGRLGRALGPGSCESIGKRTAPTQRYCGARGPGARPPAASARRPDLPEASSGPQRCLLRFFTPTLTPGTGRESVCVCWGGNTETNNKPPLHTQPPLLFGNEFWQEISA